jgi:hypothetical protein
MSEDVTKQPVPVPQAELPAELVDYLPLDSEAPPSYPWQMIASGVLWMVLGVLMLCYTGVIAASSMIHNGGAPARGLLLWLGFSGLFGVALLIGSVRVIRGTMRKLVSNMVLCGGIGLYDMGWAVVKIAGVQFARPSMGLIIVVSFQVLTGVLLLAAGVLALLGKSQYEEWCREQNVRLPRRENRYTPFRK